VSEAMAPGSYVEQLPDGRWKAEWYPVRGPNPFASRMCETRTEAEAYLRALAADRAEYQRRWLAERRHQSDRKSREFVARARARAETARKHLQRARAAVTRVDGFLYRRSEFRSLRHTAPRPRPASRARRVGRSNLGRRQRPPTRDGPSDDDSSDLARLRDSAESGGALKRLAPESPASELRAIGQRKGRT
jgi:hypothetical protein